MEKNKSNTLGILGVSLGWLIPIVGFVLGIIALSRKEPCENLGILSICLSILSGIVWFFIYL